MDSRRRAIKAVMSQSAELRRKLLPYLVIKDGELREIDFDRCMKEQDLSSGLRATIIWMRALWFARSAGYDLIELSFAMDVKLRAAVLRALKMLWEPS